MKKILLVLVIALSSVQFINAQENMMSLELQAGVPTGSVFSDAFDFGIGANFTYYFSEVAENFHVGARGGYTIFLASESDFIDDFDFVTLAASGRYGISENLFARLDFGYAIGLADEVDGAIFFEPRVGYDTGGFEVSLYYQSIQEDFVNVNSFGDALGFKF